MDELEKKNTQLTPHLSKLSEEAREIVAEGVPANTRRTYNAQWRMFLSWCDKHDRQALPTSSETLVLYLTERSKRVKVSTLNVALAAVTVAHRESGMVDWAATDLPGVRVFMRGLRRKKAERKQKKKALSLSEIVRGLPQGDSEKALRDRALLLVGYFSALRRSELVGLDTDHIFSIESGYGLHIARSKTDKESEGQQVSIPELDGPVCPVKAIRAYLSKRPETLVPGDPLFMSMRSRTRLRPAAVSSIVKATAKRAGLEPSLYGAHSLRSGFATDAARVEAEEREIMRITRHRSERTVREYIQEGTLGAKHPGRKIAEELLEQED